MLSVDAPSAKAYSASGPVAEDTSGIDFMLGNEIGAIERADV